MLGTSAKQRKAKKAKNVVSKAAPTTSTQTITAPTSSAPQAPSPSTMAMHKLPQPDSNPDYGRIVAVTSGKVSGSDACD